MAEARPRIPMIDPAAAEGDVATLFDAVQAMLGRIPHSYRILAQSPLVAKMLVPFNAVLQRQGAGSVLTTHIKEMVVIKTSRFMDSLRIPVEVQGEVDKIKRSLVLDPAKVKTYLETVVATWPARFPRPGPEPPADSGST